MRPPQAPRPPRPAQLFVIAAAALCMAAAAHAQVDVNNLDGGRPLRLEDAYPVSAGELVLELGTGFSVERHAPDRGFATASILYGALPNLQLGLGGFLSTQPDDIGEDTKSGDLQLSALYNFNQETTAMPALGAKFTLNLPTGTDSSGVDGEIKSILTKSFDSVSFHLNAGYEFLSGTPDEERDGRWKFAVGAGVPLGAPLSTRTTLVTDLFAEEGPGKGQSEILGAEIGLRYQLTPRTVVDVGVGSEFAGSDRSPLFAVAGISFSF